MGDTSHQQQTSNNNSVQILAPKQPVIDPKKCSICFEQFTRRKRVPISLICGHTFCKVCIRGLAQAGNNGGRRGIGSQLTCGVCRAVTFAQPNKLCKNVMLIEFLNEKGDFVDTESSDEEDQTLAIGQQQRQPPAPGGNGNNIRNVVQAIALDDTEMDFGQLFDLLHSLHTVEEMVAEIISLRGGSNNHQTLQFSAQLRQIRHQIADLDRQWQMLTAHFGHQRTKLNQLSERVNRVHERTLLEMTRLSSEPMPRVRPQLVEPNAVNREVNAVTEWWLGELEQEEQEQQLANLVPTSSRAAAARGNSASNGSGRSVPGGLRAIVGRPPGGLSAIAGRPPGRTGFGSGFMDDHHSSSSGGRRLQPYGQNQSIQLPDYESWQQERLRQIQYGNDVEDDDDLLMLFDSTESGGGGNGNLGSSAPRRGGNVTTGTIIQLLDSSSSPVSERENSFTGLLRAQRRTRQQEGQNAQQELLQEVFDSSVWQPVPVTQITTAPSSNSNNRRRVASNGQAGRNGSTPVRNTTTQSSTARRLPSNNTIVLEGESDEEEEPRSGEPIGPEYLMLSMSARYNRDLGLPGNPSEDRAVLGAANRNGNQVLSALPRPRSAARTLQNISGQTGGISGRSRGADGRPVRRPTNTVTLSARPINDENAAAVAARIEEILLSSSSESGNSSPIRPQRMSLEQPQQQNVNTTAATNTTYQNPPTTNQRRENVDSSTANHNSRTSNTNNNATAGEPVLRASGQRNLVSILPSEQRPLVPFVPSLSARRSSQNLVDSFLTASSDGAQLSTGAPGGGGIASGQNSSSTTASSTVAGFRDWGVPPQRPPPSSSPLTESMLRCLNSMERGGGQQQNSGRARIPENNNRREQRNRVGGFDGTESTAPNNETSNETSTRIGSTGALLQQQIPNQQRTRKLHQNPTQQRTGNSEGNGGGNGNQNQEGLSLQQGSSSFSAIASSHQNNSNVAKNQQQKEMTMENTGTRPAPKQQNNSSSSGLSTFSSLNSSSVSSSGSGSLQQSLAAQGGGAPNDNISRQQQLANRLLTADANRREHRRRQRQRKSQLKRLCAEVRESRVRAGEEGEQQNSQGAAGSSTVGHRHREWNTVRPVSREEIAKIEAQNRRENARLQSFFDNGRSGAEGGGRGVTGENDGDDSD